MKSYEEYDATAKDGKAFSNGSEWEIWQWNTCLGGGVKSHECVHDDDVDTGGGCPLILLSLTDRVPAEWSRTDCTAKVTRSAQADMDRQARRDAEAAAQRAIDDAHYPLF